MAIIISYFPLILNHEILFNDSFDFDQPPFQYPVIPLLKPTNMNDASDSLWRHVSIDVQFVGSGPPLQPKVFLVSLVGTILRDNEQVISPDFHAVTDWISQSRLFGLIASIVSYSIQSARSLILGDPFYDETKVAIFGPAMMARFLSKLQIPLPPDFSFDELLIFIHDCVRLALMRGVELMEQIMRLFEMLISLITQKHFDRYAERFWSICFAFLPDISEEDRPAVCQVLTKHSSIAAILISGHGLFSLWFPVLLKLFGTEFPRKFVDTLIPYLSVAEHEMLISKIAPEFNRERVEQIEKKWAVFQKKTGSVSVYPGVSYAVTRCRYIAMCKHYLLAQYSANLLASRQK
jgi:hypothetical protein